MLNNIDKLISVYKNLEAELGPPTPAGQADIDAVHGLKNVILRFATIFELTSLPESQEDCEYIIETIPALYDHRDHLANLAGGVRWLEKKCGEADKYREGAGTENAK